MSRRGSESSYSCYQHDLVFRKHRPNPRIKFRLMVNGVRLAIGDEEQLTEWAARHRLTGHTVERDT